MLRSVLADFVDVECVPRLAAADVYHVVKFEDLRRRHLRGRCPFAGSHGHPGSFVVDTQTLRWSCLDHCRRGGQSVLAFLNGGHVPRPGTGELKAVVQRAAQLAGTSPGILPDITAEVEHEFLSCERIASLLETFFVHAYGLLRSAGAPARHSAEAFLARHGLEGVQLEDLPVGLVADIGSVRRALEEARFSTQEIDASSLAADERLAGRLVGPIRDPHGRILSFWARHPLDRTPRLLFKGPWKEETALVGLDAAFHAAGPGRRHLDDLLVLERLFDALVLQGLGFPRAAAVAGPASDMTRGRWERLAALGVRRVTLVPDDSEASRQNVLVAVENVFRVKSAPEVWVLLPEGLGRHPTAAELARARGLREFQTTLRTRLVHAYVYKALALLKKHRPASGWNDAARHAAWKEAIEFYVNSDPKSGPDLDARFIPAIVEGLQRSWDTFQPLTQAPDESQPFENVPRPPIPAPAVAPSLPEQSAHTAGQSRALELPSLGARREPVTLKRASRNGSNGHCELHRCDTTVCFCFD